MSDDRASSRRALLTGTGTALAGGALALAGCGSVATGKKAVKKTSAPVRRQDIEILDTRARPRAAHRGRLHRLHPAADPPAAQGLPAVPQRGAPAHRRARLADQGRRGHSRRRAPTATPSGTPPTGRRRWRVLHSLEALQISSYLEWIPRLSPAPVRAAVASILTVDAQHLTMVRVAAGPGPRPRAVRHGIGMSRRVPTRRELLGAGAASAAGLLALPAAAAAATSTRRAPRASPRSRRPTASSGSSPGAAAALLLPPRAGLVDPRAAERTARWRRSWATSRRTSTRSRRS